MERHGTRRSILGLAAALVLGLLMADGLLANGGTLRLANIEMGAYRVSVFTDPTPVRPDTLDVSVLVLRGEDGSLASDVSVRVRSDPVGFDAPTRELAATREAADDPRYHAAKFALETPGTWRITVAVEGPEGSGEEAFELRAREWGVLANPFFVIFISLLPLALLGWWLLREPKTAQPEGISPDAPRGAPGAD